MIISDGTTDLTFTGTQSFHFIRIDQSSSQTTGGSSRTIRSGKRFVTNEKIRVTGSELASLITLLTNGANEYYYTPSKTPEFLSDTDFPMPVKIEVPKKNSQSGGGSIKHYIELDIEGADYL